jgi:hypothetical protein
LGSQPRAIASIASPEVVLEISTVAHLLSNTRPIWLYSLAITRSRSAFSVDALTFNGTRVVHTAFDVPDGWKIRNVAPIATTLPIAKMTSRKETVLLAEAGSDTHCLHDSPHRSI